MAGGGHQPCTNTISHQTSGQGNSPALALRVGSLVPPPPGLTLLCYPEALWLMTLWTVFLTAGSGQKQVAVVGGSPLHSCYSIAEEWQCQLSHIHSLGAGSPATPAARTSSTVLPQRSMNSRHVVLSDSLGWALTMALGAGLATHNRLLLSTLKSPAPSVFLMFKLLHSSLI